MDVLCIRSSWEFKLSTLNLIGGETTAFNCVSPEADLDQGVTQDLAAGPGLQDLPDRTAGPGPGQDQGPGPDLDPDPGPDLDPGLVLAVVHLRRAIPRKATAPAC